MLSIGQIAKLSKVTTRTLRFYESEGLIKSAGRGENNYRYYNQSELQLIQRIKELQDLGFSLVEIKEIQKISKIDFVESLKNKLVEVSHEVQSLSLQKNKILSLLSVSEKIEKKISINDTERKQFMDAIKEEIVQDIYNRYGLAGAVHHRYLERDKAIYGNDEKQALLRALKKCVEFAKLKNLKLGPGRGSSPASIVLYSMGFSGIDPLKYDLIPERLLTQEPDIHIDVEYERGQEFVDFCRQTSAELTFGKINAFKMPLLDIINNTHKAIGKNISYEEIDENSDIVLNHFRRADIEKIFLFDLSEDALVMKYEGTRPEYLGLTKITEYLRGQKIYSFRDIVNITALWRPSCQQIIDRLELYKKAKVEDFSYDLLNPELKIKLKSNFGRIIYHEDILEIISHYTGWDFEKSNRLRRELTMKKPGEVQDIAEFRELVSPELAELVIEENKWVFCKPHAVAFAQITKQTAVLKSLFKNEYLREINNWEQKHGFRWDDIGIKIKGVSLHQG